MIVQVVYFPPLGGAIHTADMADGKMGYDSLQLLGRQVFDSNRMGIYDSLLADRNKWS